MRNLYDCPVYKTRQRGPTYIWTFSLKTKSSHPSEFLRVWVFFYKYRRPNTLFACRKTWVAPKIARFMKYVFRILIISTGKSNIEYIRKDNLATCTLDSTNMRGWIRGRTIFLFLHIFPKAHSSNDHFIPTV